MLRLAQLKYPSFPLKVTPSQATVSYLQIYQLIMLILQFMVHETCYFASNYEEEIKTLGDPAAMAASTTVVQFPYTEAVSCADSVPPHGADTSRSWSRNQRQKSPQLPQSGYRTVKDYKTCKPRRGRKK